MGIEYCCTLSFFVCVQEREIMVEQRKSEGSVCFSERVIQRDSS